MTALPAIPTSQLGLFEQPQTKVCANCKHERKLTLFAWKDAAKTERGDVCNTCRISGGNKAFGKKQGKQIGYPQALIDAPHQMGDMPIPLPLWTAKKGEAVKLLINDERTGMTILVQGVIVGAKQTSRIEHCYGQMRNWLVRNGYQIAEIRQSVVAPLLERIARIGQA